MKKLFYLLALLFLGLSTACNPEPEPTPGPEPQTDYLKISIKEIQPSNVTVEVTTKSLKQVLFLPVAGEATDVTPSYINNRGYKATVPADGSYTITIPDLQVATDYTFYFTGITTDDEYCDIQEVKATTTALEGVINVFDIEQRSVKAHINLPQSTVDAGRAFRWLFHDLATYNTLKMMKSGDPDAAMLVGTFDPVYPSFVVKESRTLIFSNDMQHMAVVDEDGNPVYDIDDNGEQTYRALYDPLVPGEVIVFAVGEYDYGHISELIPSSVREKYQLGTHAQTGKDEYDIGYYLPLFDWGTWFEEGMQADEAKYWTGFYHKQQIKLQEPDVTTSIIRDGNTVIEEKIGDANFTINKEGLLPYGGSFTIIPDPEIINYQMFVMSDYDYQQLISGYLEGNEDHLRWFTSSWAATQIVYAFTYKGPYEFVFNQEFVTVDPDVAYHLVLVGFCDKEGSKQVFVHDKFFLPDPKEPKPVLEITALENNPTTGAPLTANEIAFNVKCTTKNAISIAYACNYTRDWDEAIGSYGSDLALIVSTAQQNGAYFGADEIKQVNSDAGYSFTMWSREDAANTFGAVAYNIEQAPSDAALCFARSRVEEAAPKVESALYEELAGDWTATATIAYVPVNSTKTEYMELKSKVTIGELGYPADAPSEFKAQYANSSNGWRGMWSTYTGWVDKFNEKTANQNRILMQGFDFQVPVEGYDSDLRLMDPYALMVADAQTYSGYNTEACFWDFGPKWYLELQQDGSVGVPFNYAYFAPMTNWNGYEYHLIAVGAEQIYPYLVEGQQAVNGYFPTEISADKNTITVKPFEINGGKYYPNAAYYTTANGWVAYNVIYSDIVLTRGWSEPAAAQAVPAARPTSICTEAPAFQAAQMPKSMTTIPTIQPIKKCNLKMVSGKEEMLENGKKMLRKQGLLAE